MIQGTRENRQTHKRLPNVLIGYFRGGLDPITKSKHFVAICQRPQQRAKRESMLSCSFERQGLRGYASKNLTNDKIQSSRQFTDLM